MAVTTTNLTAGAGTVYAGAFGATEPTGAAAPSAHTDVGATTDGVTVSVSTDFLELEVDQLIETPERRVTKREVTLATNLAETTLENLAVVLNEAKPAAATGTGASSVQSLELAGDLTAYKPNYSSIIFDGPGPGNSVNRVIGRKLLSTEGTEFAYQKDSERVYSATWTAHYVSSAIKSVRFALLGQ